MSETTEPIALDRVCCADEKIARLEAERQEWRNDTMLWGQAKHTLRWYWETYHSCACGARAESPSTHPHVVGCPVAQALLDQKGDAE